MQHIPGKLLNRNLARLSNFRFTRARMAEMHVNAEQANNHVEAMKLGALLNVTPPMPKSNQRQKRHARRVLFAAGVRSSVAFAR